VIWNIKRLVLKMGVRVSFSLWLRLVIFLFPFLYPLFYSPVRVINNGQLHNLVYTLPTKCSTSRPDICAQRFHFLIYKTFGKGRFIKQDQYPKKTNFVVDITEASIYVLLFFV